jgi:UPF0271 protein
MPMPSIDLNADLGELNINHDASILPYISSANIACGVHAGNPQYITQLMQLCQQHGVAVGAHPSYWDHQHFGRQELNDSPEQIYQLMIYQLGAIKALAQVQSVQLKHVKPHGALYNRSAIDIKVADAIAQAVFDTDSDLILVGLANSASIERAKMRGLNTAAEAFADRRYTEHGLLVSRSQANAMIENSDEAIAQVLGIIQHKKISCESGQQIELDAQTICLHGDGPHALEFAKSLHHILQQQQIQISASMS